MFLFLITTKYHVFWQLSQYFIYIVLFNNIRLYSTFYMTIFLYAFIYICVCVCVCGERKSIFYKTICIAFFFPQAPKPDRKKRRKKDTDIVSAIIVSGFAN